MWVEIREILENQNTGILIQDHSEILENIEKLFSNSQLKELVTQNAYTEVRNMIGKMLVNNILNSILAYHN